MSAKTGIAGLLAAVLSLLGGGDLATAATLKADYQLQGSFASRVVDAPALVDIGAPERFVTETVDGVRRQVLVFPRGGGVSLATAGLVDRTSHSIVMVFRLSDVSGYRRLLDFSGGKSDDGLYDLEGGIDLYAGGGDAGMSFQPSLFDDSWVQVTLTSEATLMGSQWTVAYVNGAPVAATTTTQGFGLGSGVLRFFRDNTTGPGRGEQSGGALACVLVYDGALTTAEAGQLAGNRTLCPAPKPAPPPHLPYKTGIYQGRTSQGLSISLVVGPTSIQNVLFRWRAKCADGRVHTNGIVLGAAPVRGGRFSVSGVLSTGGRARVSGRLTGSHARGTLSRWANSAFHTTCVARGVRWRAHLVSSQTLPFF